MAADAEAHNLPGILALWKVDAVTDEWIQTDTKDKLQVRTDVTPKEWRSWMETEGKELWEETDGQTGLDARWST